MDNRDEVREFLTTRRARITPERAGLPRFGQRRRVPGLRREEVAQLAGVSTDYYTRLEKGNLRGASEAVLEAIAGALQLDDAERAHLFNLARTARELRPTRRRRTEQVRDSIQHVLDAWSTAPAIVANGRLDLVAHNALGAAFYAPVFASPERPANLARFTFLDAAAQDFYPDWNGVADITVAILRTEAGRDPYNRSLTDLVGELATRSDEFRARWAAHNVRIHQAGTKTFRHPIVGEVTVEYNTLPLPGDPGLSLTVYTATPASADEDKLRVLASWAATQSQAPAVD